MLQKKLSGLKMSNKLSEVISSIEKQDRATEAGLHAHAKLQNIIIDTDITLGDTTLIAQINSHPELLKFFGTNSKTEVPIAGYINGRFASRRIDRLVIDEKTKEIFVLDYKTDVSKTAFHDDYTNKIKEYQSLLVEIYPNYRIRGFILWTHDFSLEEVL